MTLKDLPTSVLVAEISSPQAQLRSDDGDLFDYVIPNQVTDIFGIFGENLVKSLKDFNQTGFYTHIFTHSNLFLHRMFYILEQSTSIDVETVLECEVNNTGLTDEVVLRQFCPLLENSTNTSSDIKVIFSKLMKATEPQFVLKGLINFIWMEQKIQDQFLQNPLEISLLPLDTARLLVRSLLTLDEEERESLLNLRKWKQLFLGCGVHTNLFTCTDTTRDFCIDVKAELGLTILFTIFLPGLVHGIGNLLFHQVPPAQG